MFGKYLKYKKKYLRFKNMQNGGMADISSIIKDEADLLEMALAGDVSDYAKDPIIYNLPMLEKIFSLKLDEEMPFMSNKPIVRLIEEYPDSIILFQNPNNISFEDPRFRDLDCTNMVLVYTPIKESGDYRIIVTGGWCADYQPNIFIAYILKLLTLIDESSKEKIVSISTSRSGRKPGLVPYLYLLYKALENDKTILENIIKCMEKHISRVAVGELEIKGLSRQQIKVSFSPEKCMEIFETISVIQPSSSSSAP